MIKDDNIETENSFEIELNNKANSPTQIEKNVFDIFENYIQAIIGQVKCRKNKIEKEKIKFNKNKIYNENNTLKQNLPFILVEFNSIDFGGKLEKQKLNLQTKLKYYYSFKVYLEKEDTKSFIEQMLNNVALIDTLYQEYGFDYIFTAFEKKEYDDLVDEIIYKGYFQKN